MDFKQSGIYQRNADELEDTVHLVEPGLWMGLLAVSATIIIAIVMSFNIEIQEKIHAEGVLLGSSGVIANPLKTQLPKGITSAQLTRYRVKTGDIVQSGDIIAEYSVMSLKHELEDLTKQQEILEQKRKRTLQLFSEERVIDQKTLRDQRAYYGNMIASHKATIDVLTDLEARQKRLSFSGGSSHFDRHRACA